MSYVESQPKYILLIFNLIIVFYFPIDFGWTNIDWFGLKSMVAGLRSHKLCLISDVLYLWVFTKDYTRTYPRGLVQQCLLQHLLDHLWSPWIRSYLLVMQSQKQKQIYTLIYTNRTFVRVSLTNMNVGYQNLLVLHALFVFGHTTMHGPWCIPVALKNISTHSLILVLRLTLYPGGR